LKIITLKLDEIVPYENNAKEHPQWQVDQIAKSIQEFGFNDPIAVNGNKGIIEGHGRYLAAKELGMKELPCIILDNLTEEQERAYIIAHNKLTMNTGFDLEVLEYELNALKVEDFDLELTGFDETEIEDILNGNEIESFKNDDIEEIESFNETYNITIVCKNIEEAEELNQKLNLNLDLTRQVLKKKFEELNL
jgi:ParB-like chromosome segregation protein Spo0J